MIAVRSIAAAFRGLRPKPRVQGSHSNRGGPPSGWPQAAPRQALQHSGRRRQLALQRRRVRSRWSSCAPRQWIKDNGEPRLFGGGEKTSEVRGSCIRTPTPGRRLPDSQCHPTRRCCGGVAALDLLRGWWPRRSFAAAAASQGRAPSAARCRSAVRTPARRRRMCRLPLLDAGMRSARLHAGPQWCMGECRRQSSPKTCCAGEAMRNVARRAA